jgi:formamidopyrimidine-DNA glycosylase
MPELPDVEVFRRYLDSTSLHQTIQKVEVKNKKILGNVSARKLQDKLKGHTFIGSRRYGKYLFANVDEEFWLLLHFGMTGSLKYFKNVQEEPPHTRVLISFDNNYHLVYDCQRLSGTVSITEKIEEVIKEKELGGDALELNLSDFKQLLKGRRGGIKSTLMNQKIIAGIGNIYSDEILFQTGIHPESKVNNLGEEMLKKLFDNMREVLNTAIKARADPNRFPDTYMIPHRDRNSKCPLDNTRLEWAKVINRTAYYCPRHQKKL